MNSNNRIAATLYSLGTQFYLRNISINTLHNGDDNDNDDDDDDDDDNNKGNTKNWLYPQFVELCNNYGMTNWKM